MLKEIKEQIEVLISQYGLYSKFKRASDLNSAIKTKENIYKMVETLINNTGSVVIQKNDNTIEKEQYNSFKRQSKEEYDTLNEKYLLLEERYNDMINSKQSEEKTDVPDVPVLVGKFVTIEDEPKPKKKGRPKKAS